MAIFQYPQIFLLVPLCICFLYFFKIMIKKPQIKSTCSPPTNWPLVGMLPGLLLNVRRIHDYVTELLSENGGTFEFKGPVFSNMDMVFTCDPANIHYIFSKNFSNYPKGDEFRKIFEILGDGIFNADFEMWELHRRTTMSFFSNVEFHSFLENSVWETVENGLLPVLENYSKKGVDLDLQDVFQRFTFDNICKLVLNHDPGSLSVDLPYVPSAKGFNDVVEALLHRHFRPESIWKLQKWLKIGNEKKLLEAWKAFDEFIYPRVINLDEQNDDFSLLKIFRQAYNQEKKGTTISPADSKKFLRDTSLNLMFAGRDTTSSTLTWLFWLIAQNPLAETKIREEIETLLDKEWRFFNVEDSRKMVYLHGALCESLRLFPPVAFEHKAPIKADILPSGNYLRDHNTKVIISFYSTGRMESVWGEDCLDFKPERWISPRGGVKHEPSYKFPAFNAGPRTCLGKDMAFIQMKMVAATIIYHYGIQVVEAGHQVISPRDSVILQMKHGLKVRLWKRNTTNSTA